MDTLSIEEVKHILESAGFHIHSGMRGQVTWKGNLNDRLGDLAVVLHKYYNADSATKPQSAT